MMVRHRVFMAVTWQHGAVESQRQNIEASTRHDVRQPYGAEHIIGSKSYPNMVCSKCENMVGAKLKVGAEAYLAEFSKV